MSAGLADQLNLDLSVAVEHAHRSLVRVTNRWRGAGSGVVWNADGLIATNAHLVGNGPLTVGLEDGRNLDAEVVGLDEDADVAFLSTAGIEAAPIEVGNARDLRPGDLVLALGFPWGITDAVTSGVVIGVGDDLGVDRSGREWLAVNMRLRPGNSGGPVVDARGRLVGLSTIMAGPRTGLAVPSHIAAHLAESITTPKELGHARRAAPRGSEGEPWC